VADSDRTEWPNPAGDGVPNDNTTLLAVLDTFGRDGWNENMSVTEDGQVRCPRCRNESDPGSVTLDAMRRLEGASDPADMVAVLALTCPNCTAKGVVVANYGPEASEGDAILLNAVGDADR
jgi:hypothetical protein